MISYRKKAKKCLTTYIDSWKVNEDCEDTFLGLEEIKETNSYTYLGEIFMTNISNKLNINAKSKNALESEMIYCTY